MIFMSSDYDGVIEVNGNCRFVEGRCSPSIEKLTYRQKAVVGKCREYMNFSR